MIICTDAHDGWIDIHYHNDVYLGALYREVDGLYYWLPILQDGGILSAHVLIEIGNKLNELNKDWEDSLDNTDI